VPRLKKKSGLLALDGIAVALAGLLCLELHFAMEPPVVGDVGDQRSAGVASQAQVLQTRNVSAPPSSLSTLRDMMLSRPLFDPTRRPPAAPAQVPAAPMEIPRLSGIMVTPTEKIAVFSPATGAPIVVNQNSRFGPFTVLAISGDSVTIKTPSGVSVLGWEFGAREKPETTPRSTLLADGISLSLIKIALPNVLKWPVPPTMH
jgi:hypothetical protein